MYHCREQSNQIKKKKHHENKKTALYSRTIRAKENTLLEMVGPENKTNLPENALIYTTFSMKYLVMCQVYTDVGGIK